MKRKELLKKGGSIALAFALSMQYIPAYAELYDATETIAEEGIVWDMVSDAATEAVYSEDGYQQQDSVAEEYAAGTEEESVKETEAEGMSAEAEATENSVQGAEAPNPSQDMGEEDVLEDDPGLGSEADMATKPVYEEAEIRDVTCGDVETNTKYQFVSFLFGDKADNVYEGYITGLQGIRDSWDSFKDTLQELVNSFLSRDEEWWDVYVPGIDCVDAEKHSGYEEEKGTANEDGYPYGDNDLCWAAATSNMLEYSGWSGPFADEDEIFTDFTNGFYDHGGFTVAGLEWFFNGVNPRQNVDAAGNQVLFPNYVENTNDSAQQRVPGTGGYYNDYFSGNVVNEISMYDEGFNPDVITDNLQAGNAVGMNVDFVNDEGYFYGAHALTVFGYIRNLADQGMSKLKAFFIADSDSDKYENDCELVHTDAKETEEQRKSVINTFYMEYLEPSDSLWYQSYNMYSYSGMDTIIRDFAILNAKANTTEDAMETEGTKDPVNTPDLAFDDLEFYNEVYTTLYENDLVGIALHTKNFSYTGFQKEDDPTINFVLSIYKDGEFYEETQVSGKFAETYVGYGMGPLGENTITMTHRFDQPGDYTVKVRIASIVDKDGNPLKEAYTSNNEAELHYTICERPEVQPGTGSGLESHHSKKESSVQDAMEKFCNCFCTKFGLKCECKECKKVILRNDWITHLVDEQNLSYIIKEICNPVKIELPENTVKEEEMLHVFLDNEFFCEGLYKVTEEEDGKQIFEIDGEIMRKIGPGNHKLLIETEDGFCLYHIMIG